MQQGSIDRGKAPVALWLYLGVAMLIIQVLLGGITRLTGSGLSITEWKPILGTIPPLNEGEWRDAFAKYQQIGQYKHLNNHFTLSDFKSIYFWEWFHRNWARLIGLVFIIPFLYFLVTKKLSRGMVGPMVVLFLLGILQGLIGWVMVKSGLNPNDLYVSHIRLAVHFIAAMVLLCYLLWFALDLSNSNKNRSGNPVVLKLTLLLLVLVFIQLTYGAFMAGSHAALAAQTWPTINGEWLPDLFGDGNLVQNLVHNLITIQFIHRGLAYLIFLIVVLLTIKMGKQPQISLNYRLRFWLLSVVLLQITLGVIAVVDVMDPKVIGFNIAHQFVGMMILLFLVVLLFFNSGKRLA